MQDGIEYTYKQNKEVHFPSLTVNIDKHRGYRGIWHGTSLSRLKTSYFTYFLWLRWSVSVIVNTCILLLTNSYPDFVVVQEVLYFTCCQNLQKTEMCLCYKNKENMKSRLMKWVSVEYEVPTYLSTYWIPLFSVLSLSRTTSLKPSGESTTSWPQPKLPGHLEPIRLLSPSVKSNLSNHIFRVSSSESGNIILTITVVHRHTRDSFYPCLRSNKA